METPEHVRITLELGTNGWSTINLSQDADVHTFIPTHIWDNPFEELINFSNWIIDGKYPCSVFFQDEPGSDCLYLDIADDGGLPILKVLTSPENHMPVKRMEEVAEYRVDPGYLVTQIVAEMERTTVLLKHSIFQKDRSNFPWREYRELKMRWEEKADYSKKMKRSKI